ncbi:hypothetical protein HHK36_014434 [Tetracentron sinense]|uniref:Flavin-containing monooxygenase n=1 Tax=Tetracentron sinense TaxID=13715 RepID=A0A834Z834_TETSI|nr:hypothetical protein HHK36_014434 [Tetracentron sinense]
MAINGTGPLELKNSEGKTPVLDIGALKKIRYGEIKFVPGIKKFSRSRVELFNGEILEIDSIILVTGYRSNVPSWLQDPIMLGDLKRSCAAVLWTGTGLGLKWRNRTNREDEEGEEWPPL